MGTNAWSKGTRWLLRGSVAAGLFLVVASNAAAGCVVAGACSWDTNGDGIADTAYAGAAGTSGGTAVSSSGNQIAVRTAGTSATTSSWWVNNDGDVTPDRLYAGAQASSFLAPGQPIGAWGTAYMVDYEQGDAIDYLYASAQAGVGSTAVGVSGGMNDIQQDGWFGSPFAGFGVTT